MKITGNIASFCVLATSVGGVAAFVQGPKSTAFKTQAAEATVVQSSKFNFYETSSPSMTNGADPNMYPSQGGAMAQQSMPTGSNSGPSVQSIWETTRPETVQGGSLKTWSFADPRVQRVQVLMRTEGRPLCANIDLWQGPDNTPQKLAVYSEDGAKRPFSAVVECLVGSNSIAMYNTGHLEFPMEAIVEADMEDASGTSGLGSVEQRLSGNSRTKLVQGGAIHTFPFDPFVESVQVLLRTDGRPLNARVELLQGPNNNKQVMEIYTEDGMERPFFAVIETPGVGNVVRIVNTATVEFPLHAAVEAYQMRPGAKMQDPAVVAAQGWDTGGLALNRAY